MVQRALPPPRGKYADMTDYAKDEHHDLLGGTAKALADAPPKPIKEGVSKEEAQELKTKLEAAGATVEIK